jgi:hypothetical protein
MEGELRDIRSQSLQTQPIQLLLKSISDAAAEAADLRDREYVDNPDLRRALSVVEEFLRDKHRICYGGMAINAHLPKSLKFYDFSKTLPDYDFFTSTPEEDVKDLTHRLKNQGFTEISARVGIHEGTTKVFVNYVGVADISYLPPWLIQRLQKRAIVDDGISYADADFLRMNMYLELSRPRGETERWEKVYKRLLLLNQAKRIGHPSCKGTGTTQTRVPKNTHEQILEYIAKSGLIFAGAELKRIYEHPTSSRAGYVLKSTAPIVAFAENPEFHLPILRQIVHEHAPHMRLTIKKWPPLGDVVPEMYGIVSGGNVFVLLIREEFCYGFNTVELPGNQTLRIASLDTAITLYFTLTFVRGLQGLVPKSLFCFANTLVDISRRTRDSGRSGVFPLFSVECQGHQPSKPSLLRAKAARIASLKRTQKTKNRSGRSTRSQSTRSKTKSKSITYTQNRVRN